MEFPLVFVELELALAKVVVVAFEEVDRLGSPAVAEGAVEAETEGAASWILANGFAAEGAAGDEAGFVNEKF